MVRAFLPIYYFVKGLPEARTLFNRDVFVRFLKKSISLVLYLTVLVLTFLRGLMLGPIFSLLPPARELINVFFGVDLVIVYLDDAAGVLPVDPLGLGGKRDQFGLRRFNRELAAIFIDLFVGGPKHADEEIMGIVVRMSLLEVITDDTAICWFDGSVGLPGSTILIDYPAEF